MPLIRRLATLRFVRTALRTLIVLVLGAWGVLLLGWLTLHWGILPQADQWRPQIEAQASQALGATVRIGHIEAASSSWVPALRLTDVVLSDTQGRETLRLPRVDAALSPKSLFAFKLIFAQLHLSGAQLEVRRDALGRLHVGGLQMDAAAQAAVPEHTAADWFFQQREFVIRDATVRWVDEKRMAPPLELTQADLVVRNGLREHEIRLDGTPPAEWGQRFSLRGRFTQPLFSRAGDWRRWSGTVYADLPLADVASLRRYVNLPFDLREGNGALRLWLDMNRGRWRQLALDVALDEVEMRLAPALAPLGLSEVVGRLTAARTDKGVEAAAERLRFTTAEGEHWPDGRVALFLDQAQAEQADWLSDQPVTGGRLEADRLDVALLARLAARLPLPADVRQGLEETQPEGRIEGLRLSWQGAAEAPAHYRLQAKGAGLSIAAQPAPGGGSVGRPGWRLADVELDANETGGEAKLTMRNGQLIFPGVFEEPVVPLQRFSTRLVWAIKPGAAVAGQPPAPAAVELRVQDAQFANADAQGELQARWHTGPGEGFGTGKRLPGLLELQGRIHQGQATKVARYLPLGIPQHTRDYVAQAVRSGTVHGVDFKVKGDLWEFPYPRSGEGDFRIAGQVRGVDFVYVPPEPGQPQSAWPALSQVSGELVFDRTSMAIKGARGRVWGLSLGGVDGRIADLVHTPVLEIGGSITGPLNEALRFVRESPVNGWTQKALNDTTATGDAALQLALRVPLDRPENTTVKGGLTLTGHEISLKPDLPLLSQAKGQVAFTEQQLTLSQTSVRVAGGDATVEGGSAPDGRLRFEVRGRFSAEGLAQTPQLSLPAKLAAVMRGDAPYSLTLDVGREGTAFELNSTLTGLALALPEPLRKAAAESWPLKVNSRGVATSGTTAARETLTVDLSERLRGQVQREWPNGRAKVLRGAWVVGAAASAPLKLPESGVSAEVQVPQAHLEAWQQALVPLLATPGPTSASAAGPAVEDEATAYLPGTVQVRIQDLLAAQRHWTDVDMQLQRQLRADGQVWRGQVRSEQARGQLEWHLARNGEVTKVAAKLAHLSLPAADPQAAPAAEAEGLPAHVPALDLRVEQFEMRGKKLGRLEIEARERSSGGEWRLQRLALTQPEATLVGSGVWTGGPQAQMALDLKAELQDAGALLERLGAGKVVRGGKGKIEGSLRWPGSPLDMPWEHLSGQFQLDVGAGQFLRAEPGAARLLGILSLQSLPRRLTLDFRDVFDQGFSFDTVNAEVKVANGIARTGNLRIQGVQAQVLLEGSSHLQKETLKARMFVVPDINAGGASLAYAAVNPAVGLGTFIAQYLFRKPLREAGTREFTIGGTWSEPTVDAVERKSGEGLPAWLDSPASAPQGAASGAASGAR
ncbi:YhdP family protein [Ideonella sp.]|uniref:YhdP family protein n=1 Tax=Ideonella sp. TaxID=1929293 RepID=UPI0037C0B335